MSDRAFQHHFVYVFHAFCQTGVGLMVNIVCGWGHICSARSFSTQFHASPVPRAVGKLGEPWRCAGQGLLTQGMGGLHLVLFLCAFLPVLVAWFALRSSWCQREYEPLLGLTGSDTGKSWNQRDRGTIAYATDASGGRLVG